MTESQATEQGQSIPSIVESIRSISKLLTIGSFPGARAKEVAFSIHYCESIAEHFEKQIGAQEDTAQ